MSFTHPDILKVERDGYLRGDGEEENELLGYCEECGYRVTEEYSGDAYRTDDGKLFCTVECCHKNLGIRRVDV